MKHTKKGFTLIEMIVVIAIIGILTAVLLPSMMSYYRNAKMRSNNSSAKTVFNAAQTAAQTLKFEERHLEDSEKAYDGKLGFYIVNEELVSVFEGSAWVTPSGTDYQRMASLTNFIFSESKSSAYIIYMDDYIVKCVAECDNVKTKHVGTYPVPNNSMDYTITSGLSLEKLSTESLIAGKLYSNVVVPYYGS